MNDDADAKIELMISSIQKLEGMAQKCAPDIALAIEAELHRTIAEGTTPYGEPWQLTKTGKVPLRNAAAKLRVVAVGATVFIRLEAPDARHHRGWVKGKVKRQVIPDKKRMPDAMTAAVKRVLDSYFVTEVKNAS